MESTTPDEPPPESGYGFSFPYGVPLVVYPLLLVGVAAGRWWSMILAVVAALLAAAFTWEGLSEKEYQSIYAKDPTMNRLTWRINWLVFFALPGWLVALVGLAQYWRR